jgi:heme A synthase
MRLRARLHSSSASEEVTLNWNKWVRQTHRWLSMAFTVAVIVNIVAVAQKKYTNSVGFLAVIPLALQFFTGLYLFVLPYVTKWRSGRRTD